MTSCTCRRCEISKKLTWNPYSKKYTTFSPDFFFSHTLGTCFRYLPEGCPYMLIYSALHIMQWFSQLLDVFTQKVRRKIFDFNIFINQNKHRLHKTWSDRYTTQCTTSRVYHRRQTDLLLCTILLLPPLKSSSKHGRWRSSLLLYSISMSPVYSSIIPPFLYTQNQKRQDPIQAQLPHIVSFVNGFIQI